MMAGEFVQRLLHDFRPLAVMSICASTACTIGQSSHEVWDKLVKPRRRGRVLCFCHGPWQKSLSARALNHEIAQLRCPLFDEKGRECPGTPFMFDDFVRLVPYNRLGQCG